MQADDGVVLLRQLELSDVDTHLAGEDDDLVRWYNGGPGTRATVEAHVRAARAAWEAGGPTFTFGICTGDPAQLVGTVDAHLTLPSLRAGQANIAYGLYPSARGRAWRREPSSWCATSSPAAPRSSRRSSGSTRANGASAAVALRAGFTLARRGVDGELDRYVRNL
ncbi:MAG TPA: GNAT family N-acetyltransferase [Actinomycetes bacterium]|nr:GNAT family N-acetyltransferase [Actinomycetes bacterium]